MNVTAKNHDEVSALLTVTLDKSDYKEKVDKTLINYAKNAQVPGFRKGKVPVSMVKKQYEAGIAFEEINKQISEALNAYVNDNKLRLVGQPVPLPVNELDYNADQVSVAFEVGYEPELTIDLSKYEAPHYKVEASDKEITTSVENMQKRFAERVEQDKIGKDSYVALEVKQVVEEGAEGEHNHAPKQVTANKETKAAYELVKSLKKDGSVKVSKEDLQAKEVVIREDVKKLINKEAPDIESNDKDYVFIYYILNYLPTGIVGLLIAVILSAAMSSTSSELNALATTTVVDIYKRNFAPDISEKKYLNASRLFTLMWGMVAIFFAVNASLFENLIQAVNIIGSLFYGVILGVFAIAFLFPKIGGKATMWSILIVEPVIILLYFLDVKEVIELEFLWLNPIGCLLMIGVASLLEPFMKKLTI